MKLLLGIVLAWWLAAALTGLVLAFRNVFRPRAIRTSTPAELSPDAVEVEFPGSRGYRLRGYLAPPAPGRPMLVFQHGVGTHREDVLPSAAPFAAAGYGVLAFDWSAHGESEGTVIAFGAREPEDLLAGLALVGTRLETRGRPIAIVAVSMGAAITALAADRLDPLVQALVLDSPFGDLGRMVNRRLEPLGGLGLPARLAVRLASVVLTGTPPEAVVPEASLEGFSPRPILVLHGEEDEVIPPEEGESLAARYPGEKEIWISSGDRHLGLREDRLAEWVDRVAGFLERHLPGAPTAAEVVAHLGPGACQNHQGP